MYFVFVLIVALLYFVVQIESTSEAKKQKMFCIYAFLVILFVHIFKDDSFLPDLDREDGGYKYEFEYLSGLDNFRDFLISYFITGGYFHEIGWSLFNFIISRFTDDFTIFQKIVSFVICVGYSYGIFKLSKSPLFSFLFIMLYPTALFQSFYVLRQHLAASLFFLFIPSIANNDFKRIVLGFVVVISIHYSAVILLPFYFFIRLGNKLYTFKRLLFIALLLGGFAFLLDQINNERYAGYVENKAGNVLAFLLTGGTFCVFALSRKLKKNIQTLDGKYDIYIITYMLYSAIICLACLGTSTGRLTNYFTIFLSISVPYSVCLFNKQLRLCVYAIFMVYCIFAAIYSDRSLFQYQLIF